MFSGKISIIFDIKWEPFFCKKKKKNLCCEPQCHFYKKFNFKCNSEVQNHI